MTKGFAAMSPELQLKLARMGGRAVPPEKRKFARDREAASAAGKKGGMNVAPEHRSFSLDREFAAEAGRKGGKARKAKALARAKALKKNG